MADWLISGAFCLLLAGSGWPWAEVLAGRRPPPLAQAGLGYLVGSALVTLGMLLVAFAHIPITRAAVLGVIAGWWAIGEVVRRRRSRPEPSPAAGGRIAPAVPALAVAVAGLAYMVLEVFRSGRVDGTDFIAFWGRKGLAVFFEHNLDFSNLHDVHNYYPLEISNLFGGLYLLLGHVNDEVIRLPLTLFAVSLAVVTWWMCRLVMSPALAALAVALPITAPHFSDLAVNGGADFAMAAYVAVAVMACFLWVLHDDPRWAPLAGMASGAASWCKVEGAVTCGVLLVTVMVLRRSVRVRGAASWLAWFAAFVVPWLIFRGLHDIHSAPHQFSETNFNLLWIVTHVSSKLTRVSAWGGFWPVCIVVIVLTVPLWWRTQWRLLAALTLPNVVLTLGAYVFTYDAGSDRAVAVTAPRLYMHLAPSLAIMAAAAIGVAWQAWVGGLGEAAAQEVLP
jgi:hypothetical protein